MDTFLIEAIVLGLAAVNLALHLGTVRTGSPVLAILNRWSRWVFIAALMAGVYTVFIDPRYEFFLLFPIAFLLWFVVETGYNYLVIQSLSKSQLPLFPRFEENTRGDEWPSQSRFIHLKNWLRAKGFQRRQALVSLLGDHVLMRLSCYENEGRTMRVQVLFLPASRGNTVACLAFSSHLKSGEMVVTDNLFLPFGGFYPEHWHIERRPWTRKPRQLHQRHRERLDAFGEALAPFEVEPLAQVNDDQRQLEKINRELGFLREGLPEEGESRLTSAGKARIWQEIWTLAYLGKPLPY
ncbi:MAG: hypothetical protein GVY10_07605 [Verrucomicrobia bacterium]|jgi:hypothetical protein|nr:hypothetical protein [Verrucomicrobiota bacterium]